MSVLKGFELRIKRVRNGIDTGSEMFLQYVDRVMCRFLRINSNAYMKARLSRLRQALWCEDDKTYHIKDVRLPALSPDDERLFLLAIFDDTFGSYLYCNDKYDEATVNLCDEILGEGVYGLVNDHVNVTVETGDIVIDAGAWVGDFAAYASVKGATTYAFEPTEQTYDILCRTAELNGGIIPVKKGLSDTNTGMVLFVNTEGNSGGNSLLPKTTEKQEASSSVETVRLDDFVRENNIPRVDFIKADIEGFERHMLAGAQETLARFAPKLALCTYHLPDDPQVMAGLIKQANPRYNIVQKRMKLFASVPEN